MCTVEVHVYVKQKFHQIDILSVDVYFASYMEKIRCRLQVSELRVYSKILEPKRD